MRSSSSSIRLLLHVLCGMSFLVLSVRAGCKDLTVDGAITQCGNVVIGSTTLGALTIAEGCNSISNFDAWLSCLTLAAASSAEVEAGVDGTIAGLCIQSYACDFNCAVNNSFVDDTFACSVMPTSAPTAPSPTAPTPSPGGSGGGGACFGKDATVQVEHLGPVAMKHLSVGDKILTITGGSGSRSSYKYEPVYAFAHYDPMKFSEFLSIHTSGSGSGHRPLDVTPDHLLMVSDQPSPVRAGSIQVGDVLQVVTADDDGPLAATNTNTSHSLAIRVVTDIQRFYDRGLYAPLTPSGTLVVDGVVASNYVALQPDSTKSSSGQAYIGNRNGNGIVIPLPFSQHFLAHLWLTPLRVLCTTGARAHAPSDRHQYWCQSFTAEEGIHPWASLGMDFAEWSMQQTSLVGQALLLLGFLVTFLPLYVAEHIFLALALSYAERSALFFLAAACLCSLVMGNAYFHRQGKKVKVL